MNTKQLIFLSLLIITPVSEAVKVYKIVDENGNVTFSQMPPGSNSQAQGEMVEELTLKKDAMSNITTEFGYDYCGSIRLPQASSSKKTSAKYHAKNIMSSLKMWRKSLDNLVEKIDRNNNNQINSNLRRHNSSYSSYKIQQDKRHQEQRQNNVERMKNLRCAINWAENRQDQIDKYQAIDHEEKTRLLAISTELERELVSKCGEEPAFDPTDQTNEASRKSWYRCSKDIMRDLRKVEQRLGRL